MIEVHYIPCLKWTVRHMHRNIKDVTFLHHLQVGPEPAHSALKQCNNNIKLTYVT